MIDNMAARMTKVLALFEDDTSGLLIPGPVSVLAERIQEVWKAFPDTVICNDFDEVLSLHANVAAAVCAPLLDELDTLRRQLAAIKSADPDLFDPRGGDKRGAAYETYGSPGHNLRLDYLAAIGLDTEKDPND
jgi:hypothetical protein